MYRHMGRTGILLSLATGAFACGAPAPGGAEPGDSVCDGVSDLSKVPESYLAAITKYTTANDTNPVVVCTEDDDGDGNADSIVVESINVPEHESFYFEDGDEDYEDFDFGTNEHKYGDAYEDQRLGSAGNNKIEEQFIIMKLPIAPVAAASPTNTGFGTIGLALNGVSFFNERAAPGDEITEELFTFDQCSGHPQQQGVYHYHVDPVCLIRDLGGDIETKTVSSGGNNYEWLEDAGTNGNLLLGFLMDGFAVYGPVGTQEVDCDGTAVDPSGIDALNGHSHCNDDFSNATYHYHVRTGNEGALGTPVFWLSNAVFYGEPGSVQ